MHHDPAMGLSRDDLVALLDAFEESQWTEMILTVDGTRLELTSSGRPPQPRRDAPAASAAPAAPAAPAQDPPPAAAAAFAPATPAAPPAPGHGLHEVTAPSVGIFYRAPEPGAPPFVEEGQHVGPDDIVCIVEVMKLMNHVKAGVAGVVCAIHAENGAMIEHGQVLFTIEADA